MFQMYLINSFWRLYFKIKFNNLFSNFVRLLWSIKMQQFSFLLFFPEIVQRDRFQNKFSSNNKSGDETEPWWLSWLERYLHQRFIPYSRSGVQTRAYSFMFGLECAYAELVCSAHARNLDFRKESEFDFLGGQTTVCACAYVPRTAHAHHAVFTSVYA